MELLQATENQQENTMFLLSEDWECSEGVTTPDDNLQVDETFHEWFNCVSIWFILVTMRIYKLWMDAKWWMPIFLTSVHSTGECHAPIKTT